MPETRRANDEEIPAFQPAPSVAAPVDGGYSAAPRKTARRFGAGDGTPSTGMSLKSAGEPPGRAGPAYHAAMRTVGLVAVHLAALLAASPGQRSVPSSSFRLPTIAPVESPAASPSGQPQLTVSRSGILLSWVERDGPRSMLKFAERTASGWSTARTAAAGSDWFVNWADVPSVLRLDDRTLVAHWLQKSGAGTYAYDVRLARSTDDGRTWSAATTPHHDGLQREHGFASLVPLPRGGLALVWLDGRHTSATPGHDAPGASGGAMSLRYATFDGQWRQTSEVQVDARVCDCCPTTAVMTPDGPLVAYRDRGADETRDISVARLEGGTWSAPRSVHADNWQIAACPVNGPRLSVKGRDVALAWFTGKDDVGRSLVAFSKDAGRSFGPPTRLDADGSLGRVDVALLPDGSAVASWIEPSDTGGRIAVRRVTPAGEASAPATVATVTTGRISGYPRMAFHAGELVFAWTEGGVAATRVQTAVAKVPGTAAAPHGAHE